MARIGVTSRRFVVAPIAEVMEDVRRLEDMGVGAVWFPESVAGREAFALAGILLAVSSTITVAPGIANIWARDPAAMANGARALGEAHPGRFMLGVGVSHRETTAQRGHDYGSPLARMEAYLEAMHDAPYEGPPPDPPVPVILAALGPRMLRLATDHADGAFPTLGTVAFTAHARSVIGPDKHLVVSQAVVADTDAARARERFRAAMGFYLATENYRRHLVRMGWTGADVDGRGSDAQVDGLLARGSPAEIAARVAAHLEAGADEVVLSVLGDDLVGDLGRILPALR